MEVDFRVEQACNADLVITGESKYPQEESYKNFLYKESVTINIVTKEDTENFKLVAITYNTHSGELDESHIPIDKDGLYNITQLVVPSLDWYEREKNKNLNNFFRYEVIYVSDGKNLYKVTESEYKIIDPLDFITKVDLSNTTISKKQKLVFLTCFLWKCYISLAEEVLQQLIKENKSSGKISKCGNENEDIKDLIYRRDFVWATINILNYLADQCKFEEAQKILDKIQSCNGFCNQDTYYSNTYFSNSDIIYKRSTCGCNR